MVFLAIFAIFIGSYLSEALNWGWLLLGINGLEVRLLNEGGSYWSAAVISVFTVAFCNFLEKVVILIKDTIFLSSWIEFLTEKPFVHRWLSLCFLMDWCKSYKLEKNRNGFTHSCFRCFVTFCYFGNVFAILALPQRRRSQSRPWISLLRGASSIFSYGS